ncbi:EAL domain-containing protein [Arthrobacter sp. NQ7]|uniref:putative bifunctional diguanylate cyclase/phosphodiesterase n=1 Tax=Arthrobacter sp. NQ7 TaxID=3032303 RepID=UPI00240F552B|nr:EAL domain-containing protein [Arthrobacter sp. NQ7]MDJ0457029.1 EAL domain-containing protein [Arthrobacter sp. NQ7]
MHAVHPLLPLVGVDAAEGFAAREEFSWHDVVWDVLTAGIGVYYWTLRREYASMVAGPVMFEDLLERQRLAKFEAAAKLSDVRRQAAVELARSEKRFRLAFEHAPIGIALISLNQKSPGRVLRANSAFYTLLGRPPTELAACNILDFTVPEDLPAARRRLRQMLAGEVTAYADSRRFLHADGQVVWTSMTSAVVADDHGSPLYLVAQFEDITARREAEQLLTRQAMHDGLTGLPNRVLLMDRISHALSRAHRRSTGVAVLFVDVDSFKTVNDTLGHAAGDLLLIEVGHRLTAIGRDDDTVARLAGDEFVVLCEDVPHRAAAEDIARRLLTGLERPYQIGREVYRTSASLGIALSGAGSTAAGLLENADLAMYRAKEAGRGQYRVYDKNLRASRDHRLRTEKELRHGIDNGQLRILCQPVINLASGTMACVEALVRWAHPDRGLLTPAEFLDVAETTGLIIPLGRWMIAEACREIAAWQRNDPDTAPAHVSVNLSAVELAAPGTVDVIAQALHDAGLRAQALWVELTESSLLDANSANISTVRQLRAMGIRIALDDFGTGYSSLTNLKRFPVDVVKIDKSFVAGLGTDTEDTAIITAVVGLAHALGLATTAEGVENTAQRDHLHRLGCTHAQGYLYSPPATIPELTGLAASLKDRDASEPLR